MCPFHSIHDKGIGGGCCLKSRKAELLKILLQLIPQGKVTTYGSLARALRTSPRAVGIMLSRNRDLIAVPCHRVVMSSGRIGGYSLGPDFKRKLLLMEGVRFENDKVSRDSIVDIEELLGEKS